MFFKYKKAFFLSFSVFLLCFSLLGVGGTYYWYHHPQQNLQTIVLIEKGSSLPKIASRLFEDKVLDFPVLFKALLCINGQWRSLKAGEYRIPANVTPARLVQILKSGYVILHPVTLIEGETSHHFVQKLLNNPRFEGECGVPSDGSLFPETYHFPRGTQRQVILNRMQKKMASTLSHLWTFRPPECPLQSPEELIILASIVEKETALPQERPMVAAVFLNRLKLDMPLQADPTVLYALTKGMDPHFRNLSLEDLKIESLHNTYLYKGLPPSPIANPGLPCLKAVLNPANVSYLYFVANGSGGHVFATTLEEHQLNHEAWRRIRQDRQ